MENTVKEFIAYPFHEDMTFLEGLQLLLGQPVVETFQRGGPISPELEQSLLGPKLFFFNRQRNTNLTAEIVHQYTSTHPAQLNPTPPPSVPKTPDEDRQLSLAELTRLIESGQTHLIPHNHVIPDGVQVKEISLTPIKTKSDCLRGISKTDEPSPSKVPIRKKPWEAAATAASADSVTNVPAS
ncbi:hypothetical protein RhiLY_12397 [Ceratobasidium sp. AG-Ba]|nr:hypothetical protein RhiLY_12397 [Ceratobasidium sp. AG-Ba]